MKFTLTAPIINVDGVQFVEGNPAKPVVIKDLLMNCLRVGGKQEDDEEKKFGRFSLLFTMKDLDKDIELSLEQRTDLKTLAHRTYSDPWIYGQIRTLLEK